MQPAMSFDGKHQIRDPQAAPEALEPVRRFLNTWWVPNATRRAEDRLPSFFAQPSLWTAELPSLNLGKFDRLDQLIRFRDELREALTSDQAAAVVSRLFERHPIHARIIDSGNGPALDFACAPEAGLAGDVLLRVAKAIGDGTWHRLKACPDCRWVFFDNTRNAGKVWCVMVRRHQDGRSCGAIAKVRRYRENQKLGRNRDTKQQMPKAIQGEKPT